MFTSCGSGEDDKHTNNTFILKINTENHINNDQDTEKFLIKIDGKESTYYSKKHISYQESYAQYCKPQYTSYYDGICKRTNKISLKINKGSIVEIFLHKKDTYSQDDYKKQYTVLEFKNNISENYIFKNTISSELKDRLSYMHLKFEMREDVNINMLVTKPIGVGVRMFCHDKDYGYLVKIYELDENHEKSKLYYEGSSKNYKPTFDLRNIDSSNILAECYNQDLDLKYRAILHLTKDEFWNHLYDKYKKLPKYEISYMTDFYYRAFKHFRKQTLTLSESKNKADSIVKSIFKDYPKEWEVGYAPSEGEEKDRYDAFWNKWNTEFRLLKSQTSMSSSEIFDELDKYLLHNNKDINNNIKAHFFIQNLQVIANEHTSKWYKIKSINSNNTGGTIQVVKKKGKELLMLDFTSNRNRTEKASFIGLVRDINIENINNKNLYFKTSIQRIEGQYGLSWGGMLNCTGVTGFWLEYLDTSKTVMGSSLFVNMEAYPKGISLRTQLGIELFRALGEGDYGIIANYTGLYNTNNRNIISVDNIKSNLTFSIQKEIENIASVEMSDISMIRIKLFATDIFLTSANTCSSKSFLEISEAGIYIGDSI